MKKIFLGFAMIVEAANAVFPSETWLITHPCGATVVCMDREGAFKVGNAWTMDKCEYDYFKKNASCCELASGMQELICWDGKDPVGVEVSCF